MSGPTRIDPPQSRDEMIEAIAAAGAQGGKLWRQFSSDEFIAPPTTW